MSNSPYAPEREYWDSLPDEALEWIKRFTKATTYGNFDVLAELCEEAPSDRFDELKSEIMYERDFYKRNTFKLTRSRYSALDHGWEPRRKTDIKEQVFSDWNGTPLTSFQINKGISR